MKMLFSLGPFSIHFFGVMIALAIIAGYFLASKEAKRKNLNVDIVTSLVLYSVLGGIIGARLGYVFFYNPQYYFTNPLEIIFINSGGLSIHGGIIGGILTGFIYAKINKVPIWATADTVVPALILGQAIGRIGCDVFGIPMAEPYFWGVENNNALLHPAQVYEFTLDYLLFGYLWLKRLNIKYNGQLLVNYLLIFPFIRSFVELFRDNPTVWGGLSISHLLSITIFISGILLRQYLLKSQVAIVVEKATSKDKIKVITIVLAVILVSMAIFYFVQG